MSNALMTMGDSGPHIDRAYADSSANQWVREITVNAIQAGATEIKFQTEWEAVAALDVHRRMVLDNGDGIPRGKMLEFLNKFGGSGRTIGATSGNYGIGAKTSSLRWNRYGFVVISRHNGEDSMLWLHYIESANSYGAREFDIGHESGLLDSVVPLSEFAEFEEDGVDWTKIFPTDQESGTAIILLGDSSDSHTILGDPFRDEGQKYGIVRYLNSAFMEIPEHVTVQVEQYEGKSNLPQDWPKDPSALIQTRFAKGLKYAIKFHFQPTESYPDIDLEDAGVLDVPSRGDEPGARIQWWLLKDVERQKGAQSHMPAMPITSVAFSSHDGVVETFSRHEPQIAPAKFVKPTAVNKRLAVVLTPVPADGRDVFPDHTRQSLKYESATIGGADLPYEYWVEFWHSNMPEAVRTALDDYYTAARTNGSDVHVEDVAKLGKRLLPYFRSTIEKLVPTAKGGESSNNGSGRRFAKHTKKTKSSSETAPPKDREKSAEGSEETPAAKRRSRAGMVNVGMADEPDNPHIISYDREEHMVTVNTSSAAYKVTMKAVLDEQEGKRGGLTVGDESAVRSAVDRAMRNVACTAVTHSVGMALEQEEKGLKDEMLSDAALSTCLHGIMPVRDVASGYIGHALGESKKKAAA